MNRAMLKHLTPLLLLVMATAESVAQPAVQQPRQRTIALHNGTRITGTILEETADSLRLQTGEGTVTAFSVNDIKMILMPAQQRPAPSAASPKAVSSATGKSRTQVPASSVGERPVKPSFAGLPAGGGPAGSHISVNAAGGFAGGTRFKDGSYLRGWFGIYSFLEPGHWRSPVIGQVRAGRQISSRDDYSLGFNSSLAIFPDIAAWTFSGFIRTDIEAFSFQLGTGAGAGRIINRRYGGTATNTSRIVPLWTSDAQLNYRLNNRAAFYLEGSTAFGTPLQELYQIMGGAEFRFHSIRIAPSLLFHQSVNGRSDVRSRSGYTPLLEIGIAI